MTIVALCRTRGLMLPRTRKLPAGWDVLGPIAPSAGPKVHDDALASGDEAVGIPFELMNPLRSGRDLAHEDRLTGTVEAPGWRRSRARMVRQTRLEVMADEIANG
jgi:hypothetical protein